MDYDLYTFIVKNNLMVKNSIIKINRNEYIGIFTYNFIDYISNNDTLNDNFYGVYFPDDEYNVLKNFLYYGTISKFDNDLDFITVQINVYSFYEFEDETRHLTSSSLNKNKIAEIIEEIEPSHETPPFRIERRDISLKADLGNSQGG